MFCAYGTAFDLWDRSDLFFVLDSSVVRIDLTLNQFRDKPKQYGGKTYVFTRYQLVGSSLNNIAEQIANSLKGGEGEISDQLSGKINSIITKWMGIFNQNQDVPCLNDRLEEYKRKKLLTS